MTIWRWGKKKKKNKSSHALFLKFSSSEGAHGVWILRRVSAVEVMGVLELSVAQAVTVFLYSRGRRSKEREFKGRRGGFRVSPLFGRHPGICAVY